MNKSFEIFVDSAANLTDIMAAETGIKTVPFICTVNGEDMLCYDSSKPFSEMAKDFYEKMAAGAEVKTSLVGEARIIEAVAPCMKEGKDVLFISIASGISGTYAQAVQAQKTLKELFPDRKMLVKDSANASLGEGLLAVNAARLRDLGESIDACAEWIEENRYKMNAYLAVNDLRYLRKGGRISAAVAIAGTILNIKPLIKADGGSPARLAVYGKERGRKRSLESLVSAFRDNVVNPENQTVAITHCGCEEDAQKLADMVRACGASDVVTEYYDLCTGSHAGPGTIAIFFMGKDRRGNTAPAARTKKFGKKAKQNI